MEKITVSLKSMEKIKVSLKSMKKIKVSLKSGKYNGYFTFRTEYSCGRDSSVGIATRYWLDGPGFESRWGRDFPHSSRPVLGPIQPPIQWVADLSRG
jgi:hypothetical protein